MTKNITTWKPGQSGNPAGRPTGSRNTVNERFLKDLASDWQKHGRKALERAREEKPAEYCRMVSSLLPKEASMTLDVGAESRSAFVEILTRMNEEDRQKRLERPRIIEGDALEMGQDQDLSKIN